MIAVQYDTSEGMLLWGIVAASLNETAASDHRLDCPVVGWSPRNERELYDESHRWVDEWLDGRRDVDLACDRRPGGGFAGRCD
jgi:hypothetical protein